LSGDFMSADINTTIAKLRNALNTIMFALQVINDEVNKLVSEYLRLRQELERIKKEKDHSEKNVKD